MSSRPTVRVPARRGESVAGSSPPASPGWVCVRAGRTGRRSSAVRNPRGGTPQGLTAFRAAHKISWGDTRTLAGGKSPVP